MDLRRSLVRSTPYRVQYSESEGNKLVKGAEIHSQLAIALLRSGNNPNPEPTGSPPEPRVVADGRVSMMGGLVSSSSGHWQEGPPEPGREALMARLMERGCADHCGICLAEMSLVQRPSKVLAVQSWLESVFPRTEMAPPSVLQPDLRMLEI